MSPRAQQRRHCPERLCAAQDTGGVATRGAGAGLGQPDVTPHPEVFTFEKWWRLQVPE